MENITIKKEAVDSKFEYIAFKDGVKLASIKGKVQNEFACWLLWYESSNPSDDEAVVAELQKAFYDDCVKSNCKVRVEYHAKSIKSKKAKWFMEKSDFVESYVNYVFEHDLNKINEPGVKLDLKPFKEVALPEYQKVYYESSKGDPHIDLTGLTASEFYEKDKKEIDYLWDEGLMYMVMHLDEVLGVLNLRTMPHPKTGEKEGAINYLGLIPSQRRKGFGKALHLTGLRKLKDLGCKSYYGGTDSFNVGMLKIFEANNCTRAEEHYCYKT